MISQHLYALWQLINKHNRQSGQPINFFSIWYSQKNHRKNILTELPSPVGDRLTMLEFVGTWVIQSQGDVLLSSEFNYETLLQ